MKEKDHNIDFNELAAKYFSGNATDAEVQQLENWVLSSTDNKTQFLKLQRTWNLVKTKYTEKQIDVNVEWETISGKLSNANEEKGEVIKLKPKKAYGGLLRIAAAVALLLAAGLWFYSNSKPEKGLIVSSENNIKTKELNDKTKVDLNKFSTVSYQDAEDGTRQVALKGDAFFDVARDENRPFVISTENVQVKVLGTSFYVDAREGEEEVQVIVASGTVAMEVDGQKVILTKGEIGTYAKSSQQLTEKENQDANYMAWKNKQLFYKETTLDKVVFDLNRTFHANVSLVPAALGKCTLTATYDNQSLESILLILEKSLNLKANINGERIVLSGSPCE